MNTKSCVRGESEALGVAMGRGSAPEGRRALEMCLVFPGVGELGLCEHWGMYGIACVPSIHMPVSQFLELVTVTLYDKKCD